MSEKRNENGEVRPPWREPAEGHSFDDLARGLANGTLSRRQALRWMGGAIAGAVLASIPGVAFAQGNSPCAQFCHTVFQGRAAGQCTSNFRALCAKCANDPGLVCGSPTSPEQADCCDPTQGENCCAQEGQCVTCAEGEVFNPATCECEGQGGPNQPCETFVCGNPLCAGDFESPISDRCACFELTETPGQGRCLGDFFCLSAMPCPNGISDCPQGFTCVTNTCCGQGVQLCAPECGVESVSIEAIEGEGPTASGA